MKLDSFILIVLQLLIYSYIVKSQNVEISSLSTSSSFSKYVDSIDSSNFQYCTFEGILVLVNGSGKVDTSSIKVKTGDSNIQLTSKLVKFSDLSSLVSLTLNQVPVGLNTLEFELETGPQSIALQFTCKKIDQSALSITSYYQVSYSQVYGAYIGVFMVYGLEYFTQLITTTKNIRILNITPNNIKISSSVPQYFVAIFQSPPANPLNPWVVNIYDYNGSNVIKYVEFSSPILSKNSDNRIQFKYLNDPSNKLASTVTFTPATQFSKPTLLLSTSNSIQMKPIIPITLSPTSDIETQITLIPINGSFDTTNNINYLLLVNGVSSNSLNISTQYYSTYQDLSLSFVINNYVYQSKAGLGYFSYNDEFLMVSYLLNNTFGSSTIMTTRLTGDSIYRANELEYPFGFTLGQSTSSYFQTAYPNQQASLLYSYSIFYEGAEFTSQKPVTKIDPTKVPDIISYVYSLLNDNQVLLRFTLSNPNATELLVNGQYYHAATRLVNDDETLPTYEVVLDCNKKSSLYLLVQNQYFSYTNYTTDSPHQIPTLNNPSLLSTFRDPSFFFSFTEFDIRDIKSISFLYNDIDTTGESYWNSMYLELKNVSLSKGNPIQVGFFFSNNRVETIYYLYWDVAKSIYKCDFKIPANILIGSVEYYLSMPTRFISSSNLPSSYQLNVYSKNADLIGPQITQIIKNEILSSSSLNEIYFGWTFTISDKINGFKSGFIIIRGQIDKSFYNISLSTSSPSFKSGDKFEGVYQVNIEESSNGISQTFIITQIVLEDLQNQKTQFRYDGLKSSEKELQYQVCPFLNFADQDSSLFKINITRVPNIISAPPSAFIQLKSLILNTVYISSSLPTVVYPIKFSIYDATSLKESQLPYVYLTSFSTDTLKFSSKLVSISDDGFTYNYTSNLEVPTSFGWPYPLFINIYGLVNNYGYYGGFPSQIINSQGFVYKVDSFSPNLKTFTTLTDVKYSNGKFNIFGRGLDKVTSINIGGVFVTKYAHSTVIIALYDLESTISSYDTQEISIYATTTQNVTSNIITYSFTKKQFKVPPTNPLLPPVNPPQQCLGVPLECGGPKQGNCTPNGCVCIFPYVGKDCSSKVIQIPPPDIDKSQPNTTIQVPVENSNDNIQSIITVVGLREVDLLSNKEIKYHPLNSWVYSKQQDSNVSLYQSSITQNGLQTNVNVSLEWFSQESLVIFANQNLTMLPSSIKYTISLSKYSFSNNFCSLQVVMLAQIQSSNNDVCSNKEFGNTTNGDNSNFIKLQVDKNSFYGRFIKRAIIDSQIRGVENVLLDSNFKTIDSTNNKQQSYIGIVIPRYLDHAIMDPDFSNLLDYQSASSLCKNHNNNQLSKGAIIAIVISCVGASILVVVSIIIVKKYKYQIKNIKNNIKLKKLNNNNI